MPIRLEPTTKEGRRIQGSFELVQLAMPFRHATKNEDGSLELEYEGDPKTFWDTCTTQKKDGERLYICSLGHLHKESDLVWTPMEEGVTQ